MRALASYDGEQWIAETAARGPEELRRIGRHPSRDADAVLVHVDPIKEERYRPAGESERGLPLRRHPHVALDAEPDLHELAVELMETDLGSRPFTPTELEERSNYEAELVHYWRGAASRKRERDFEAARKGKP